MSITAAMVKELRERTGSGMMECKRALVDTNGDIEAAVEAMRKAGLAKADKKASRTAAEGTIAVAMGADAKQVAIVEVNCETDFVAKGDEFIEFAKAVAQTVFDSKAADLDALMASKLSGGSESVEDRRRALIAKLGENIGVRRFQLVSSNGLVGNYTHGTRIGVLVDLDGGNAELAKDIAMHIAASKPQCVNSDQVPAELLEKEKEIFMAQAAESGKPANVIEKMVSGRIAKYLKEITLLGQPFVKNPDITVEQLLKDASAKCNGFVRYEVGEGIEKAVDNFAEEVMAQVRGN